VLAEGWLPCLTAASRCSWDHGSPQSMGYPWITYSSRMGFAGWCCVDAFGCMWPVYTGWYLLWFLDSWGSVFGIIDVIMQLFVLFLLFFLCDVSCCVVVALFIEVVLFSFHVVVVSLVACVVGIYVMPVLLCPVGTVVRSWDSTVIKSSPGSRGSGGCSQCVGACRGSSECVNHFSVFMAGNFVVLLARMAASTPICLEDRGVSSCV